MFNTNQPDTKAGRTIFTILLLIFVIVPSLTAENLFVPPIISGAEIDLTAGEGSLELPWGISDTYGFNGDYLGPTIRLSRGDMVKINVHNTLREDTTVHWHGLHVPGKYDGGPRQVIRKGTTWSPEITINQDAATLWYHPHLMGKTAEHVYKGMAGFFIIDDDFSRNLDIPGDYGINDIPLVFQDRRIDRKGKFDYRPGMPDLMHGYIGNVILVNGQSEPDLEIARGTYRFRLLNGSNSSVLRFQFSDSRDFTVIASDGGFLPDTVSTADLILSPGERYEILSDFNTPGDVNMIIDIYGGESFETLKLKVTEEEGSLYAHPDKLRDFELFEVSQVDQKRTFNMETRGMARFSINGETMDLKKINFDVPLDNREIWSVTNVQMGMMNILHSFHVHDVQFKIISIDGKDPPPLLRGPKDTVLILPGQRIDLAMQFSDYTGVYMYHCHFLEHEDQGMMGQFEVLR
jgi:blue copper oxidase